MVSGAVMGWGVSRDLTQAPFPWLSTAIAALTAATLNAASNGVNQVADLDVDAINKPDRPLPSDRMTRREAAVVSAVLYCAALVLAWLVNVQCFVLVCVALLFTLAYSLPPIRTKRLGILANLTIAIPRGVLLVAAGWSVSADVLQPEPWYVAAVFGGFLLGASSTKDFADIRGDKAGGCKTLPAQYGLQFTARYVVSPALVLPFLLLPIGAKAGVLSGDGRVLSAMGWGLACWGLLVAYITIRSSSEPTSVRTHVSWIHMYLMMTAAQIGLMVAYAL
jgi:4-hydroxybenzoate polyprenyltransferase